MNKPRCFTFVSLVVALVATAMVISACDTSSETLISEPFVQSVNQTWQLIGTREEKPPVLGEAKAVSKTEDVHFDIEIPAATKQLVLASEFIYVASDWTLPQTRPAAGKVGCWVHRNRTERPLKLAGCQGRLIADTFGALGMELVRDVWVAETADAVAIRQKLRNRGVGTIRLDALLPLRCEGPKGLLLAGREAEDWEVLAQKRFKGSLPTSLHPGVEATGSQTKQIEIDPFCLLRPRSKAKAPVLLAGYISQLGHCARLLLQFKTDAGHTQLDSFTAECEFDGVVLPPGGERTSQWLLLIAGSDPHELIADFADRMGKYHGVRNPPKSAPTVPCSWYFYYRNFGEKEFSQTIEYLRKDRVPFDVFLIDDSWDRTWGNWLGNEKWPSGMKAAADKIHALGYRPGIWTCPFVVHPGSLLATGHPEWMLRLEDGTPYTYGGARPNYILDPTYPGVCQYLEDTYRRLTYDWGFTYHKLDFMQNVVTNKNVRFYDQTATRLQAYRRGLEAIRRGTGPDAYISVCGGHYGGSIGIANSQRSGSDMRAYWCARTLKTFKQNILRTWMSRLWHVDPDAFMARRPTDTGNRRLTDDEIRTCAINQYIGGGMVTLPFVFAELDDYTRSLYRHIIPSINSSSLPLDLFDPVCPSKLLTRVTPRCKDLDPWVTLAVVNWTDKPKPTTVTLSKKVVESMENSKFLVFDFFSQKALGIFESGAKIDLGKQSPHATCLLRITPWSGQKPVLAGTDLHFSGGGVEIASWQSRAEEVAGRVETKWNYSVRVTAAFPAGNGYVLSTAVVEPGHNTFRITKP